ATVHALSRESGFEKGQRMNDQRAGSGFYLLLVLVTPLTFFLHELAHWATGEALGYSMQMSLNNARPADGTFVSSIDAALVSAAGPLLTLLQAVVAFLLIRRSGKPIIYPVLFIALFMRAVAMLVSLANPNDEARVSQLLGLGTWTLPALVVAGLLAMTWNASRSLRLHWTVNVYAYLVASLAVTALVFINATVTGTPFVPAGSS